MGVLADPKATVVVRDFLGMADNIDPHDPTPGTAQQQVNLALVKQGEAQVRRGYKVVSFEA